VSRLVLAFIAAAFVFAPAAGAGGWWSSVKLDRSTAAVGWRVRAQATSAFAVTRPREVQPLYVYLLRGLDESAVAKVMTEEEPGTWWRPRAKRALRVGRVSFGDLNGNYASAEATFRVPAVPPGRNAVAFCTAGCGRALGDVLPHQWFAVADAATARLAQDVKRVEARLDGALRAEREPPRHRVVVRTLERRAKAQPWAYGGWVLAGIVVGAISALGVGRAVGRRRGTTSRPHRRRSSSSRRATAPARRASRRHLRRSIALVADGRRRRRGVESRG
jgi:hypothetical protein